MLIDRRLVAQFDFVLVGLCLLICSLGLMVLYSAGYDPNFDGLSLKWLSIEIKSQAFSKQLLFIGVGLLAMLVGIGLSPQLLSQYAYPAYAVCLMLLVLVDLIGSVAKGSQRWLAVGGINLQPGEPMKLALVLTLARYLSRTQIRPGGYGIKDIIVPFVLFLVPGALIMKQPDLGTALVVMGLGFSMVLFMGIKPKLLVYLLLPILVGAYPAWHSLHDYQKKRIQVLFDPEIDPKGSGYHINQSKIAVGSGALFGKGFMQGTQTQLEFLPEHTTDFIFSVLAEEWGFVGSITVLALYAAFLYRMLRVVHRSKDLFFGLTVFGISTLLFFHIVINIGMGVGLLPVVGLPLPLFSYGGSSIVSCMFSIGIVLGLDMRRLVFVRK